MQQICMKLHEFTYSYSNLIILKQIYLTHRRGSELGLPVLFRMETGIEIHFNYEGHFMRTDSKKVATMDKGNLQDISFFKDYMWCDMFGTIYIVAP